MMQTFSEWMQGREGFAARGFATNEQIAEAERKLAVTFADEYREYLSSFGAAMIVDHELTGICTLPRLNVVDVTREERINNPNMAANLYVIEQLHIDDVVIWQSETGAIYASIPGAQIEFIASSLKAYLEI